MIQVSIITVCLNAEKHLRDCLESVERQTFDSYEHIVIDGGSIDGTLDLLRSNINPRLKWISEPDSGIAEAMNKGIEMATGEWLIFLHSDDCFTTHGALEFFSKRSRTEAEIVSFDVRFLRKDGGEHVIRSRGWCAKTPFKTTIGHQGAFIRKPLFMRLGSYDSGLKIAMDYDWFLRAYWRKVAIDTVSRSITLMNDEGLSSRRDWRSLKERFSEERKSHFQNAPSTKWRLTYNVYWLIYPIYRQLRRLLCVYCF